MNYAMLRSMQKAVYAPTDEGHYALNKEHYCHFTSPIRRYPDLTIHRMIETLARGKQPVDDFDRMVVLGEHCSDREQRAEAAERELMKVKLLMYLAKRIGEQMDAVITGRRGFRPVRPGRRAARRGADPRRFAGRRLLSLRQRDAQPGRPPQRQPLPPGRRDPRRGGPRRYRPPRAGLPRSSKRSATREARQSSERPAGTKPGPGRQRINDVVRHVAPKPKGPPFFQGSLNGSTTTGCGRAESKHNLLCCA